MSQFSTSKIPIFPIFTTFRFDIVTAFNDKRNPHLQGTVYTLLVALGCWVACGACAQTVEACFSLICSKIANSSTPLCGIVTTQAYVETLANGVFIFLCLASVLLPHQAMVCRVQWDKGLVHKLSRHFAVSTAPQYRFHKVIFDYCDCPHR